MKELNLKKCLMILLPKLLIAGHYTLLIILVCLASYLFTFINDTTFTLKLVCFITIHTSAIII